MRPLKWPNKLSYLGCEAQRKIPNFACWPTPLPFLHNTTPNLGSASSAVTKGVYNTCATNSSYESAELATACSGMHYISLVTNTCLLEWAQASHACNCCAHNLMHSMCFGKPLMQLSKPLVLLPGNKHYSHVMLTLLSI